MEYKWKSEPNEHLNEQGYPVCDICGEDRFFANPDNPNVVVRVRCKCQKEIAQQEEKERQLSLQKTKIELARSQSLLGYKTMLDKGYGFYVYGTNGCGKTHLIACLCNFLTNKGQKCIFTNFTNIANDIRKTYNTNEITDNVIDKYSKVPFLFLDDFGKEGYKKANGETGWIDEQLFTILNNRYNNMLPTIFSSNFSLADLGDELNYDRALVDRATEMSTRIIHLQGKNRRLPDKDDWE